MSPDTRGLFADSAIVDPTATFGDDLTRIWHFAVVLHHCRIGKSCSIGSRAEIGRGSIIGNRSRISAGVFLPPQSLIGESVFIGPNVTFTDDKRPCVPALDAPPYHAEPPVVESHANIGAGAVILPGVTIGHHATVGAGAVITRDVAPYAIVRGQPSNIVRYDEPAEGAHV